MNRCRTGKPRPGHRPDEGALLEKSKIGKEKVKFWMLYQRLTTNDSAAGKETGKGGKGTGKAGPGGWGREVESGNRPRAGSMEFGASLGCWILDAWSFSGCWSLDAWMFFPSSDLRPPTSGLRFWPLGRGPFWPFSPFFKWAAKKGQKVPKGAKRCQKVPKGAKSGQVALPRQRRAVAVPRRSPTKAGPTKAGPSSDLRQVEKAMPAKSKIGKEKVKFWLLHQRLTTNDPADGKETGKGGKETGKAGPGGWGREVESGNRPRAGSMEFGASLLELGRLDVGAWTLGCFFAVPRQRRAVVLTKAGPPRSGRGVGVSCRPPSDLSVCRVGHRHSVRAAERNETLLKPGELAREPI